MSAVGDILLQLLLVSALGAAVGFERELHGRPAGLRTHTLLALGAAIFGMLSRGIESPHVDPTRIAAQVVTGVGFIGAGTILHLGGTVRGLTTAASIWTTAAIGLAVGLGRQFWGLAIVATAIVLFTLALVHLFEVGFRIKRRVSEIELEVLEGTAALELVLEALNSMRVDVQFVRSLPTLTPQSRRFVLSLDLPARVTPTDVMGKLVKCENVVEVKLDR